MRCNPHGPRWAETSRAGVIFKLGGRSEFRGHFASNLSFELKELRQTNVTSKGTFQNCLCFGSVDKAATAPASNQAVACSQACETLVFDEYICTEKIDRKQLRLLLKNLQQERTKRNACLRWLSSKDTLNVVESSHQKAHDVDKAKPGYI